jgi:hypothetical protein
MLFWWWGTHPARRLGEEDHADEGYNGEEDLQGEGEAELGFVVDVAHAVVYANRRLAGDEKERV